MSTKLKTNKNNEDMMISQLVGKFSLFETKFTKDDTLPDEIKELIDNVNT
jgi:hypothetical protein